MVSDPKRQGQDELTVESATPGEDGKSVTLQVNGETPPFAWMFWS